jgi:hypothetical protein
MEKTFCIDLDDTICRTEDHGYGFSQPKQDMIDKINQLYGAGHKIIIRTGRGSTSGIDWTELTKLQLSDWGVKYHQLLFDRNKPRCDFFIDDKNLSLEAFLQW